MIGYKPTTSSMTHIKTVRLKEVLRMFMDKLLNAALPYKPLREKLLTLTKERINMVSCNNNAPQVSSLNADLCRGFREKHRFHITAWLVGPMFLTFYR